MSGLLLYSGELWLGTASLFHELLTGYCNQPTVAVALERVFWSLLSFLLFKDMGNRDSNVFIVVFFRGIFNVNCLRKPLIHVPRHNCLLQCKRSMHFLLSEFHYFQTAECFDDKTTYPKMFCLFFQSNTLTDLLIHLV